MALNVSKLTLSEYRLTQNPIWQDVLANEIAETIFEDAYFSPEEGKRVVEFMDQLTTDKRWKLKRTIMHQSDKIKCERKYEERCGENVSISCDVLGSVIWGEYLACDGRFEP